MSIWYATRETVKAALDSKQTARNDAQVDRAIARASRTAEAVLHRRFYPELDTRYFDWPQGPGNPSYRIWLEGDELAAQPTAATAGGTALDVNNLFAEPANDGPPYDRLETNRGTSSVYAAGSTAQRAVAVTGTFGYQISEATDTTLNGGINASVTTLNLTAGSQAIGVGSLLRIGTERLTVVGRRQLSTGTTLAGNLDAKASTTLIPVVLGTGFVPGETILIDAEYMLVVDVAGNNLIVKRGWDGSVLAAHTSGVTVYAPRTLLVNRGVLGTVAATHNNADVIYAFEYPADLVTFVTALALDTLLQESTGYARTAGSGDNERQASGAALKTARADAITSLGRQVRLRAV